MSSILAFERSEKPQPTYTARQVIDLYLSHQASKQAVRTLEGRKSVLDLFKRRFGETQVKDLGPADLVFWLDEQKQWKSDWTKKRAVATIQCVFNWCKKIRICSNPFEGVTHPEGDRGRPIEPDELRKMLRHAKPEFRRVIIFLYFTGARPYEMASIIWTFIDISRECIILKVHKTGRTRKDKAPRIIVLNRPVVKLLAWIRRHQAPEEKYVFLNAIGKPWSRRALGGRLERLRERAGLPKDARLYGLRHRFGTNAILKGIDIKTLSELLGHTTTRMTEHYVHIAGNVQHLHEALNRAFK